MTKGEKEWIKIFKNSGNLLKWIYNNGDLNLSLIIMYLIIDSILNAFCLSLKSFNPNKNVSITVASFFFNAKYLMLLIFSKRFFLWFYYFELWRNMWTIVSLCRLQLQNGPWEPWKFCLSLCTHKLHATNRNLVHCLIP